VERVNSGTGEVESDAFYDCIGNDTVLEQSRLEAVAQEFVEGEEAHVRERVAELQFLADLGINVLDSTLQADASRLEILPVMERMAQVRWNHLYDVSCYRRLTMAITKELKHKYDEYLRNKLD
jgi:hypothetical protein